MTELINRSENKNVFKIRKGSNAPNWKGGRIKKKIHNKEYWVIYKPDHIFADPKGYVLEHRLVYEEYYKCCLLPYTEIHHIDNNSLNNSIENLQPLYKNQHTKISTTKDKTKRYCFLCNDKTHIDKNNYEYWYKYKNNLICNNCCKKLRYQKNK